MKYAALVLILVSIGSSANPLNNFVNSIKNGNFTLADIQTLHELESSGQQIGYGLCVAAGRSPTVECAKNGSVGYGLCVIAGKSPTVECNITGTIGYGMCVLSGKSPTIECKNNH